MTVEEIFGPEGIIARNLEAYEYRSSQIEMAKAVSNALANRKHAIIEAGTGTGKTLAYLIPAIAAALQRKERIIISTGTKNLQEQIMKKDLPFLQRIFPKKFKAVYMKGRSNYVCLHRLRKAEAQPILANLEEIDYFKELSEWAKESETGDIAELEIPETLSFWRQVNARSEICLGQQCSEFERCFITKMRREAEKADIVIVNHHLFFADLMLRESEYGKVLPDYSTVIFDEAHLIEDIATTYFGAQVSDYQIEELVRDISFLEITDVELNKELVKITTRIAKSSQDFWDKVSEILNEETKVPISKEIFFSGNSPTELGQAYFQLRDAIKRLEDWLSCLEEQTGEVEAFTRRTQQIKFYLDVICSEAEEDFIYWAEKQARSIVLHASPISISELLKEKLLDKVSVILTSATLSSENSFDYIKQRLGLEDYETEDLLISSGFDYQKQAILYLPVGMPDPGTPEYLTKSIEEIIKILQVTQGRAFVLCTSIQSMNALYEAVSQRVEFPCFVQGMLMKTLLLERFRNTPNAVLFAVASFWQGVDVRGEQLSCVIIDKLPFAVPTDPLVAARTDFIRKKGGNAFYDYSVPQAIITLKQGIGRLIRSKTDTGVIAILDPRVRTKAYGRKFLSSLPKMKITAKLKDVEEFLRGTQLHLNSTK